MKTITQLNEPAAVNLHSELRLEPQEVPDSPEKSRATERKPGEAPVTQLDTSSPSFANFAETWFDDNVVRWRHSYKLALLTSLKWNEDLLNGSIPSIDAPDTLTQERLKKNFPLDWKAQREQFKLSQVAHS